MSGAETRTPAQQFMEVKGRRNDARDVTLTANEILASLNAPEIYYLAIVRSREPSPNQQLSPALLPA